jgi:hypothetical protein
MKLLLRMVNPFAMACILLFLMTSLQTMMITKTLVVQSFGLMQVAGDVVVEVKPGESKPFAWGLLSDKPNETTTIELSADGEGSEFLSFPKTANLGPGELKQIQGNVSIPANYRVPTNGTELNPTLRAAEQSNRGDQVSNESGMILNVQMAKILSIVVSGNTTKA